MYAYVNACNIYDIYILTENMRFGSENIQIVVVEYFGSNYPIDHWDASLLFTWGLQSASQETSEIMTPNVYRVAGTSAPSERDRERERNSPGNVEYHQIFFGA
jgi:hypothetical protein